MRRTSMLKIGVCAATAWMIACTGCVICPGDRLTCKAERTQELGAAAADVAALDVKTDVGDITLEAAETDEVHITAEITVKAKTDEQAERLLQAVRVTAEPSGDTLVIKARKPADFGRNQLAVDFKIAAPARLRLRCVADVGNIRAEGFAGPVEARTDVGNVSCTGLRAAANLRTSVGDVRAAYVADAPAALDLTMTTDVGNVNFTGPTEISANLDASSDVGSIHTSRPLTVTGTVSKSIKASLGDTKGRISLRTNVGSIHIQ